jgi:hypothetical protein
VKLRHVLAALLSGAAYEACSVVWVHRAVHGTPLQTAAISGLQALAQVVGIGESVRDWKVAPFYVGGYALGAYFAMRFM